MNQNYIYLLLLLIIPTVNAYTLKNCDNLLMQRVSRKSTLLNMAVTPQPPIAGQNMVVTVWTDIADQLVPEDRIYIDLWQPNDVYAYSQQICVGNNSCPISPGKSVNITVKVSLPGYIDIQALEVYSLIAYWDSQPTTVRQLHVLGCSDKYKP
ncbi:27310_t:CDS:1 [Racocetra persica]|uniref:27310_t:CDS:1 n=1 Tax=Racocetra persica TaxID=160502 RepID=A0ACA9L3Z0_9GLOM|nr:27310_t:CDS:1 [Racocetra persica]